MRTYFIAGNWKMNKTSQEGAKLAEELKGKLTDSSHKLMVAPPFTTIPAVSRVLHNSNILLGAQNCSFESAGAHTGEISVDMLKEFGVKVVIVGHSERRHTYLESDEIVNAKVKQVLSAGLEVILCVGETLKQREKGQAEIIVEEQIKRGLEGTTEADLKRVTIAYEPVWAIGTGKTATPEDADAIHAIIRQTLEQIFNTAAGENMVIQYGGSVKPDNVNDLMAKENIDGALVGGASLQAETFLPIIQFDSQGK
jgi:triosephosphate isomerase (TIM)